MPYKKTAAPGFAEFITLMAMMMSLVALSIDTMLPALSDIGKELGVLPDFATLHLNRTLQKITLYLSEG